MRLDYSVPNFQFLIGGFDCTDYLDEISLSLPMHEIGQTLTWTGRFKVSYNRSAIKLGLAEGDFDPWVVPGRWRPAQVPVTLKIKGHTLPIMRIDRYSYNHQNQAGEGTLHQILDVVAFDRPAEVQVGGATISGVGALPVTSVAAVVDRLVGEAFRGARFAPPRLTGGQAGLIYGLIYSRNPIQDAQKLCGAQWQWLTVDALERILAIDGSPPIAPLFTRTLGQIEWEPDIDHLNFAAQRVIVTGSHQQPAKVKCPEEPVNPVLDRKGRPKLQKTVERQPFNQVFARNNGGIIEPTTSEVKWIFYQYPDDLSWDSQIYQFIPTNLLFDLQTDKPIDGAPIDSPCQTVTVAQWPAGRIFSKLGTDTSLAVYSLEIQSERRRGRFVPIGVLKPSLGNVFKLAEERYEILTTKPVEPGNNHAGVVDPKTGQPKCLEPLPKAEERKPLAELPLETVAVKGLAFVSPPNWVPIIRQDLIMEVGFLPSDASADYLAQQVAKREAWRRDSAKVSMPIPDEWLVAGCPPFRRCYLHDGHWQMDGLILSLQAGEARFAFTAARIDRQGSSAVVMIENILFDFIVEAETTLDAVSTAIGQFVVEAEIAVQSGSQVETAFIIEADTALNTITMLPDGLVVGAFIVEAEVRTALVNLAIGQFIIEASASLGSAPIASLVYASAGDSNGLFYYLGTAGNTQPWINPLLTSGSVIASSNLVLPGEFQGPEALADRVSLGWASEDFANSWVAFDVGNNRRIRVTDYLLRARSPNIFVLPRNWELQGTNVISTWDITSINNASWSVIQTETNNTGLVNPGDWNRIVISANPPVYRYLRLYQYGSSSTPGFGYFTLGEVEFYGILLL